MQNLIWKPESYGPFTYEEAKECCEFFSDSPDWRIPTIHELLTLIDFEKCKPASSTSNNMNQFFYWSNTRFNIKSGYIWCVDFTDGHVDYDSDRHKCYVKYVRNFTPAVYDKIYERFEFLRKENLELKESDINKESLFQFWKMFNKMSDEFDINNITLTPTGKIHTYLNNGTNVLFRGEKNA